jgi:hypothetical protein
MKYQKLGLLVVILCFTLSFGFPTVSAEPISEWVNETKTDPTYSQITEPKRYFSGDYEIRRSGDFVVDSDIHINDVNTDPANFTIDALSAAKDNPYAVYDVQFSKYPSEVSTWNQINSNQYRDLSRYTTVAPGRTIETAESGRYVKDAVVGFHSITPSVYVHTTVSTESNSFVETVKELNLGVEFDEVEHRVGSEASVNAIVDYRLDIPEDNKREFRWIEYDVETADITRTIIRSTSCRSESVCILDSTQRDDENPQFRSVEFPEPGRNDIIATAEVYVEIEKITRTRDEECETVDADRVCSYTPWKVVDIDILTDEVETTTSRELIVESPSITVEKAVFPSGAEEFYITDLDPDEWKYMSYVSTGERDTQRALSSSWQYFSSRDARWDTSCEIGEGFSLSVNNCLLWSGDISTGTSNVNPVESDIRPLWVHAFPQKTLLQNDQSIGTVIRDIPEETEQDAPVLQSHPTCKSGFCSWIFIDNVLNTQSNTNSKTYTTPREIVIRRAPQYSGSVFTTGNINREITDAIEVTGLVPTATTHQSFTRVQPVVKTQINAKSVIDPTMSSEERTRASRRLGVSQVSEDETILQISLFEAESDRPISLSGRNETVVVDAFNTDYSSEVTLDGTGRGVTVVPYDSYEIRYNAQPWYTLQDSQTAYLSAEASTDGSQVERSSLLSQLIGLVGVFGTVIVASLFVVRAMGLQVTLRELTRLLR